MRLRLLDRYVLSELLYPFIFGIASFSSIFIASSMLFKLTQYMTKYGASGETIARLFMYSLPEVVNTSGKLNYKRLIFLKYSIYFVIYSLLISGQLNPIVFRYLALKLQSINILLTILNFFSESKSVTIPEISFFKIGSFK